MELIAAIVEMKRRNPKFGCVRIAQQISHAFGVDIDKDVVRRVLAKHFPPGDSGTNDPSWLTFIGHVKDSLWSVELFRCESIQPEHEFATCNQNLRITRIYVVANTPAQALRLAI
ncbi:MAG: helix-turn-helix domain-containing protein [Betaproteobacteria bacterium]|nr:helix-turn-helix domain-containing protein [Betaproteobacteria bacterium]